MNRSCFTYYFLKTENGQNRIYSFTYSKGTNRFDLIDFLSENKFAPFIFGLFIIFLRGCDFEFFFRLFLYLIFNIILPLNVLRIPIKGQTYNYVDLDAYGNGIGFIFNF
jgi:hypothetical protein